ncbi:MAG: Cupin protein [Chloroflexi bacterium]|nr:Cupin protein [Chloroflexota bacterium]
MSSLKPNPLDTSHLLRDDKFEGGGGDGSYEERQRLRTKGWQVVSLNENADGRKPGQTYIPLTSNRYANAIINVYEPGQRDEMHCHPGSEHLFMVLRGELHLYGVNDGEDVVLKPGELVHINASYYYQLSNETDQVTILYQVATKPPKPSKISRYSYRGPQGVDPTTLEGE